MRLGTERLKTIESIFVVLSFLFLTKGLEAILPSFIITALRYLIIVISLYVLFSSLGRTLYVAYRGWLTSIILVLLLTSFLWSDFPSETLLRIRSEMLPMSLAGLYVATRFTARRQLVLLSYTLALAIFFSIVVAILLPSIGFSPEDGTFKGIWSHRNGASSYGVLAAITFFSLSQSKDGNTAKWWLGYVLATIFVLITTSKTGLVTIILIPLITFFYSKLQFKGRFSSAVVYWATIFVGITIFLVIDNWTFLLGTIGGDPTLTGRTPMWGFMLERVAERPWLGYGRTAFWAPPTGNSIRVAQTVSPFGYEIFHAHNGYIDLLLDVGWVGFLVFLAILVKATTVTLRDTATRATPENIWALSFLTLLIANNVSESLLTWNLNLFWVLFVSMSYTLAARQESSEHKRPQMYSYADLGDT